MFVEEPREICFPGPLDEPVKCVSICNSHISLVFVHHRSSKLWPFHLFTTDV